MTDRSPEVPAGDPGVRPAVPADAAAIAALCRAALPPPHDHLPSACEIAAFIASDDPLVAVAGRGGELAGCIAVSTLAWDSDRLAQRIARVSFLAMRPPDEDVASRLLSFAIAGGATGARWDSLWLRIAAADVALARGAIRAGAEFMGTLVTFEQRLDPGVAPDAPEPGALVRPAVASDIPALRRIAAGAFRTDRYHHDPAIDPSRVDAMWAESVENAVRGRASAVLVADPGDGPAGFVTLHRHQGFDGTPRERAGVIGLIAVAPGMEGRGTGRALVEAALDEWRAAGVATVEVGTQGDNAGAIRLYGVTGFVLRSVHLDVRVRIRG